MKNFETVSFHIVKPCNFKCKFCYATFNDFRTESQMHLDDAKTIIDKLIKNGVEKITFAGGEPMLYKELDSIIKYSKYRGLTTSIITNGSFIKLEWLKSMKPFLDWIGVSVDSTSNETNEKIGRKSSWENYGNILSMIKSEGYKLKINTVVNKYNKDEDFNTFIDHFSPDRWKVFQALRVEGQNEKQFDEIKITENEFSLFLDRHSGQEKLVFENNDLMTGSYLLIDPRGRMFENSLGRHTYSDSLIYYTYDHCVNQINLNREKFLERGGVYNW